MFPLKALYCRIYQIAFRMLLPILPYRQPQVFTHISQLKIVLEKEKMSSLLIVTDRGIVDNNLLIPLLKILNQNQIAYTIYDQTQANPSIDNVEMACTLYQKNKCDSLLAIGGGSPIDCAKAIGARIAYPHKELSKMKGILRVLRKIPTLIAVPTTAGTGSEVTLAAVISDPKNQTKYALMSFPLIPKYAILDPRLCFSLPPHITAATGMDALTHAIEAYIGRSTTKETRKLALQATKLIFENIETAYQNGHDYRARANMLSAAYQAGHAFSKSYVGYIHAIAHSLGGKYGTPHGLANAVIMPYVLKAYGRSIYPKLHQIACYVGLCQASDSYQNGAFKLIEAIETLNQKLQIPTKLKGIQKADIPFLAKHAEKEANPLYPVPKLMTSRELARLYYQIADWRVSHDKF